jgi:K+-transporting ATPase ATPase C chain
MNMFIKVLSKSFLLLISLVVLVCLIYPAILWIIGQTIFPFQANGSILYQSDNKPIGSKLIAQSFTKDEYFQPRPSAASYDGSASASSTLAASNYALRDRVARTLGPIAKYENGQAVAPDIEKWFQQDLFQGKPNIVAQWATLHNSLATAWVTADPTHIAYVDSWAKAHHIASSKPADIAVQFFQTLSKENPGKFPSTINNKIEMTNQGTDIQSIFFDMWRQDHPDVVLQDVPGDLVTTSASGLDPHISLQNALYQLDRVAAAWATRLKRSPDVIHSEINEILQKNAEAPLWGLAGEKFVNVLEVNLELNKYYE